MTDKLSKFIESSDRFLTSFLCFNLTILCVTIYSQLHFNYHHTLVDAFDEILHLNYTLLLDDEMTVVMHNTCIINELNAVVSSNNRRNIIQC